MKRVPLAILTVLALSLGLPAVAPATLAELGVLGRAAPSATPSCPGTPCIAISRTTGFQAKVVNVRNPLSVTREGRVVAWTITLAKPNTAQIKYFETHLGGEPEAAIAILAPQKKPLNTYKLIAQSPAQKLKSYYGKTVEFPLETTLPVKKGYIVALTVPTWAPALALNLGSSTSWRASRSKSQCESPTTQTSHTKLGSSLLYYCLYQTARLTYSATLISTP